MTKDDLKLVKEFLENRKILMENTRVFKEEGKYVITIASIETKNSEKNI